MAADQQFCLRWNNHQSTLISVFDTLLENGTLVDCTLAAEGQYLKAHKVVLSACSPYMETLLSQNYDKHPILILKDVKFTELKSMMDYMYRGEVNISQDQLGTFLKAAESLQIKGLSENGEGDARDVGSTNTNPPPPRRPPATRPEPEAAQSPAHRSRDGSVSPSSRKRRRLRRNSDDGDNHIESNSCDVPAQSTPVPNIPASITTTPIRTPIVKPEVNDRLDHNTLPAESGLLKEKIEPAEPLLEPKTEYLEDLNNDDSVEDLTLDDDDEMDMSQMSNLSNMSRPGPSHGADLSNQGFPPWQLGNQSGTDEVFMAAQEAVNAHRDSQDKDSHVNPSSTLEDDLEMSMSEEEDDTKKSEDHSRKKEDSPSKNENMDSETRTQEKCSSVEVEDVTMMKEETTGIEEQSGKVKALTHVKEDDSMECQDGTVSRKDNTKKEENDTTLVENEAIQCKDGLVEEENVGHKVRSDEKVEDDNSRINKEYTEESENSTKKNNEDQVEEHATDNVCDTKVCNTNLGVEADNSGDKSKADENVTEVVHTPELIADVFTDPEILSITKDSIVLFDEDIDLGTDLGIPVEVINLSSTLESSKDLEDDLSKNAGVDSMDTDDVVFVDSQKHNTSRSTVNLISYPGKHVGLPTLPSKLYSSSPSGSLNMTNDTCKSQSTIKVKRNKHGNKINENKTIPIVTQETTHENMDESCKSQIKLEKPMIISKPYSPFQTQDPKLEATVEKKETNSSNSQKSILDTPLDLSSPTGVRCVPKNVDDRHFEQHKYVKVQDVSKSDDSGQIERKSIENISPSKENPKCSKSKANIDLKGLEFLKAFKLDSRKEFNKTLKRLQKAKKRKLKKVRNRVSMIYSSDEGENSPDPKPTPPAKAKKKPRSILKSSYQPVNDHPSTSASKKLNNISSLQTPVTSVQKKRPLSGSPPKSINKRFDSDKSMTTLTTSTPFSKYTNFVEKAKNSQNNLSSTISNASKTKSIHMTDVPLIPVGKPSSTPMVQIEKLPPAKSFKPIRVEPVKSCVLDQAVSIHCPQPNTKRPIQRKVTSQNKPIEIDTRNFDPLSTLQEILEHTKHAQSQKSKGKSSPPKAKQKILTNEDSDGEKSLAFETNDLSVISPIKSTPDKFKGNDVLGNVLKEMDSSKNIQTYSLWTDDEEEVESLTTTNVSRMVISSDEMCPDSRSPVPGIDIIPGTIGSVQDQDRGSVSLLECMSTKSDSSVEKKGSSEERNLLDQRCSVVLERLDTSELRKTTPPKVPGTSSSPDKVGTRSVFSPVKSSPKLKMDCEYCGLTFKTSAECRKHNKVFHSSKTLFS